MMTDEVGELEQNPVSPQSLGTWVSTWRPKEKLQGVDEASPLSSMALRDRVSFKN